MCIYVYLDSASSVQISDNLFGNKTSTNFVDK